MSFRDLLGLHLAEAKGNIRLVKVKADGHGQRRGQRHREYLRPPVLQLRWILHHALLAQWRAQVRIQWQDRKKDLDVSCDDHSFLQDLEGASLVLR